MGKHSNIILVDQDRQLILDSIKHISGAQNRHRSILPGNEYISPPSQNKVSPINVDEEMFIRKLDFNAGKLDQQIVQTFMGISPLLANEIIYQARLGNLDDYKHAFKKNYLPN